MPQLLAEQERRVGREGDLDTGDGLGRVPVVGELLRGDLEVELGAGAGGLGRDRVRVGPQAVDAVHLDMQVLAPGGEHLVVEQSVARVLRQGRLAHVRLAQCGQGADHDQMGADRRGAVLGVVQGGADLGLPGVGAARRELPGRDVDLQVEPAQLGGPGGVRDRFEGVAVAHRRFAPVVDQVQLDLQADLGPLGLEPGLAQHLREGLQALLHLDPVAAAVLAGEDQRRDVPSHRSSRGCLPRTLLHPSVAPPGAPHQTGRGRGSTAPDAVDPRRFRSS